MVHLNRIYTRAGDDGSTALGDGTRLPKHHVRVAAYGTVDETSSVLGLALANGVAGVHAERLRAVQNDLFDVGSDLCVPGEAGERLRLTAEYTLRLERWIDEANAALQPLASFVLPGGTPAAAWLHLARTVCRRAERLVTELAAEEGPGRVNPEVVRYLNRLSDYLFVLARTENGGGEDDVLWRPGAGARRVVFGLAWSTPPEWVRSIERSPLALLSDHAHCELRAASAAQSLLLRNPARREVVERLGAMASEELAHFNRVVALLYAHGGALAWPEPSPYAEALHSRSGATRGAGPALLDRLLVARLIEARSLERFHLLAEGLVDRELAALYADLLRSEAGHRALFGQLARLLFPAAEVERRERELVALESEIIASLPCVPRVHSGPPGEGS